MRRKVNVPIAYADTIFDVVGVCVCLLTLMLQTCQALNVPDCKFPALFTGSRCPGVFPRHPAFILSGGSRPGMIVAIDHGERGRILNMSVTFTHPHILCFHLNLCLSRENQLSMHVLSSSSSVTLQGLEHPGSWTLMSAAGSVALNGVAYTSFSS